MGQESKQVKESSLEKPKAADDIKKVCGCGCPPVEEKK